MKLDPKLKKRFKVAKGRKDNWLDLWEAVYQHVLPQRENVYDKHEKGDRKNEAQTYDSTGRVSLERLANRIQSAIVPAGSKWFGLEATNDVDDNDKEKVNEKLQEIVEKVFKYINRSNFNIEANESFLEFGIGTGALSIEDTGDINRPIRFKAIPITELYIEEGPWNTIETVFREFKVSVGNCMRMYGKVAPERAELLTKSPEKEIKICEMVVFNDEEKCYDFYVVDVVNDYVMKKDKFKTSPYVVFRWMKVAGEVYGRGPAVQALPDIENANEIAKLELIKQAYNTYGVHQFDAGAGALADDIVLEPRALIHVPRDANLEPIEVGGNVQFDQLSLEQIQDNIKVTMYADRLPPPTGGARTATEIQIRQREFYQDLGAAATRLDQEFITPIVKRVMSILEKRGLIEPVKVDGELIDIIVKSPISIDTEEVDKTVEYIQLLMSTLPPEVIAEEVDLAKAVEFLGEKMGISRDIFLSEDDKEAMQSQQAQTAQTDEALGQATAVADIANKVGVDVSKMNPGAVPGVNQ